MVGPASVTIHCHCKGVARGNDNNSLTKSQAPPRIQSKINLVNLYRSVDKTCYHLAAIIAVFYHTGGVICHTGNIVM